MESVLINLKKLKGDMIKKGWVIDSFIFNYKGQNHVVLVKLAGKDEKVPDYTLVKLEFLKENDFLKNLLVYANSKNLLIPDKKEFREYFGIEYSPNLGDVFEQFKYLLSEVIPSFVKDNKNDLQKKAMCISLSRSDSEDPSKLYCFGVMRNADKNKRTDFNDNKTRLLRPSLYNLLEKETSISFRYSTDPEKEKPDNEIITNWAKNNHEC